MSADPALLELADRYLDGDIPAADWAILQARHGAELDRAMAAARQLREAVAGLARPAPPADLGERVLAHTAATQPAQGGMRWWWVGGPLLAAAALFLTVWLSRMPGPTVDSRAYNADDLAALREAEPPAQPRDHAAMPDRRQTTDRPAEQSPPSARAAVEAVETAAAAEPADRGAATAASGPVASVPELALDEDRPEGEAEASAVRRPRAPTTDSAANPAATVPTETSAPAAAATAMAAAEPTPAASTDASDFALAESAAAAGAPAREALAMAPDAAADDAGAGPPPIDDAELAALVAEAKDWRQRQAADDVQAKGVAAGMAEERRKRPPANVLRQAVEQELARRGKILTTEARLAVLVQLAEDEDRLDILLINGGEAPLPAGRIDLELQGLDASREVVWRKQLDLRLRQDLAPQAETTLEQPLRGDFAPPSSVLALRVGTAEAHSPWAPLPDQQLRDAAPDAAGAAPVDAEMEADLGDP